jgi:hypothetical protein
MQTEINPNYNYIKVNRNTLIMFSRFHKNNKLFTKMKRKDILSYLNSLRKSDEIDPLHKWIGTYNLQVGNLTRFFNGCIVRSGSSYLPNFLRIFNVLLCISVIAIVAYEYRKTVISLVISRMKKCN